MVDDGDSTTSNDVMRSDAVLRSKFIITRHDDMYFYIRDVDLIVSRQPDCRISITTNDISSPL